MELASSTNVFGAWDSLLLSDTPRLRADTAGGRPPTAFSLLDCVRGRFFSDTFYGLELAMAEVPFPATQMVCMANKRCCFCLIFWKQGQKAFTFLTSCKKQKLKSVKMEPKLQQSPVSRGPGGAGPGAGVRGEG